MATVEYLRQRYGLAPSSEVAPTPLLRHAAEQIADYLIGAILAEDPSSLTEEQILQFLQEGRVGVARHCDIRTDKITNTHVLGAVKGKLQGEEERLKTCDYDPENIKLLGAQILTVNWLSRIVDTSPANS